ncbi:yippee-like protein [Achaetomium macrosporum]|uniref:Yippee-like protein n=1 Tax=Achaetomium macrosporum TaxID=79813 RepID=A0AAN7C3V9_9PEZI|nr:yippee-like protein [Achaetomium macrosporum]
MLQAIIFRRSGGPSDNGLSFPVYILPSLRTPFRRRRSSGSPPPPQTTSEPSSPTRDVPSLSSSPTYPASPGLPPVSRLSRARPTTLRCRSCSTDLAFHDQIISKSFTGRLGRGYLVSPPSSLATPSCPRSPLNSDECGSSRASDLVNIRVGRYEHRELTTGPHVVANISCAGCGSMVGWKYIDARNPEQKYKVGKFILEMARVVGFHSWEDVEDVLAPDEGQANLWDTEYADKDLGALLGFDSEDEDECDDLFAGTWTPSSAFARRFQNGSVDLNRLAEMA